MLWAYKHYGLHEILLEQQPPLKKKNIVVRNQKDFMYGFFIYQGNKEDLLMYENVKEGTHLSTDFLEKLESYSFLNPHCYCLRFPVVVYTYYCDSDLGPLTGTSVLVWNLAICPPHCKHKEVTNQY